ncbi:MAG: Response regulator ArlR [Candidatus Omnitrophica bacterium ADurb.Bin292]|nr:MAG: Response regulator ArlR [Candidatus Omnitrophica bacterium ADurb.Bin292]
MLIVDDETSICEEFSETLEHEGFRVDYADSGEGGIKKLSEKEYDLVFLDSSMPWMTGDKVFEKIRQISEVPVVFISGFISPEKKRKVMAMGAVSCLEKPLDVKHVKSLAHSIIRRNFNTN